MKERRYRAVITTDIWVPATDNANNDYLEAFRIADELCSLRTGTGVVEIVDYAEEMDKLRAVVAKIGRN